MPSGMDLLDEKVPVANAPNSNLAPFDVKLSEGADPLVEAKKITKKGVVSGLDLLEAKPPTKNTTNLDAYEPKKIMEKLFSKAREKKPAPVMRKVLVRQTPAEEFFAPPELPYGPKRNIPKGYKEVEMPERFISKSKEASFVTKLVDNIKNIFISKAKESARATYRISLAEDLGVNPSAIDPDLIDAYRAGYGKSIFGLISQIKRGTKYPKVVSEYMGKGQILASGLGSVAGDIGPFLAFSLAGIDPVTKMMAGFAGTQGLRSYYSYKLNKGEVSSPSEFLDVLKNVVPSTFKGAAVGYATGMAGKVAAPFGTLPKIGAETGAMTTIGSMIEGQLPTFQDFVNNAILFTSIHGIGKIPTIASSIKNMWVKTGRKPVDIVDDAKEDPKIAEIILNNKEIPEDIIDKVKAKVEEAEKKQVELELEAEKRKKPLDAEKLIKEDLKIKGKKIKNIKEGKIVQPLNELEQAKSGMDILEPPKKAKEVAKQPITDLDLQTGTPLPKKLSTQDHPFRNKDVEYTNSMKKIMQERVNNVDVSPEVFTRYLINEVNRYLNGEDVPIEKVRFGLSELAARSDNLRMKFDYGEDFDIWKNTVKEAARWARGADRLTIKRTNKVYNKSGTNLNMIIPVDKPPQIVKNLIKNIKMGAEELYRNKEIFDKTGFWLAKDGKWRYEISDEKMKIDFKSLTDTEKDLTKVIDHPTLYKIVPELTQVQIKIDKNMKEAGHYNPLKKLIEVKSSNKKSIMYEVQHAVNDFLLSKSRGSNPKAEQMEARLSGLRSNMSPEERKTYAPWETLDKMLATEGTAHAGTKLYSGIDLTRIKEIFKPVLEFMKEFDGSTNMKRFDFLYAIKKAKVDINRSLVDQSEPLLKEVRHLYPKESQKIIDRQRAAVNGKGYGEIEYKQMLDEVFSGKTTDQVRLINAYILARRFKDIYGYRAASGYKHQPGYGPDQAINTTAIIEMVRDLPNNVWSRLFNIAEVKQAFGKVSQQDVADAVRSGEAFFEWHKKIVDDLVEAGIKTEAEGKLLKAHDYRKFGTILVEKLYDFDYNTQLKGESIISTNSGVEHLGHGSAKIIDPDARISAHEMAVRAYGSIANQAAKLEWKGLAEKHPKNPIVSTKQEEGWSPMPYFEKGVRKNIFFSPETVKYLVTRSHDISSRASTIARLFTLAPLTRALAVGASPIWATFIGLPMDVIHTLWTAKVWEAEDIKISPKLSYPFYETTKGNYKSVYSPYNPLFPLKLGKDMADTFTDIYTRGPLFKNLAKHGLAMPFLSMRENRYVKGVKPPGDWAKILDILSYHGVSMEIWVRAATANRIIKNRAKEAGISYEAALKNKDIMYEAVHSARDRMDYNQGGWIIKALDQNGMIFLNAALLGTRTFWRSAKDNPVDFAVRSMQLGALATGITATAWTLHEDIMKEIPTEGNEKNIIFPLFPNWLDFVDSNGDTRHFYLKLRMDPGAAFIYKMSDNLTRTYLYDRKLITREPNYNKVVDSLKSLGPVGISLPPAIQMGYDYATNYSWWKDRQMYKDLGGRTLPWPSSRVEGQDDNTVAALAKHVGLVTGLSPKRLQGSIRNVIPPNNEFVYMFGKAYEEAFSDVPKGVREKPWLQTLAEIPGFNRVVGITSPGYDRRQIADKVNEEIELKNVVLNSKFDTMVENYILHGVGNREKIIEFITAQDKDTYERMKTDFIFMEKSKGLEHRSTWLGMKRMSLEGKAKTFVEVYDKASKTEKIQLDKEIDFLMSRNGMGIISDEFKQEVMKIRDANSGE